MTSNGWEAINFWNMALSGALSNFRNQGDWNGHNDGDWNNSGVPVRSQIWIVSNNLITSQIRRIATMHSTAKTWKPNRSAIMIYRFGIFWNFWSWKTKRKTASPWHYKLSNWGLVLEPISDQKKKNQPILMPSTLGQTQTEMLSKRQVARRTSRAPGHQSSAGSAVSLSTSGSFNWSAAAGS